MDRVCCRRNGSGPRGRPGQRAFSLTEAFIVLAILALLASMALPSLHDWVAETSAETLARRYLAALQLGRQTAVLENRTVRFCGSASGAACDGNWTAGALLFLDANDNAMLDGTGGVAADGAERQAVPDTDRLLRYLPAAGQVEAVTWKAFGNRPALSLTPLGTTDSHNGSFRFCSATREVRLVVNRTGRFRLVSQDPGTACRTTP